MSAGSQQLRRFRVALRAGRAIEDAARLAGISLGEARLTAADDQHNPPDGDDMRPLGGGFCSHCAMVLCGCADAAWSPSSFEMEGV